MKRLLKWIFLLAATGAFAIAMIVGVVKYNSLTEDYNKFRERLDQLANVKLGETQQELLYAYGKPYMVRMAEYDATRPNDEKSAMHFTDIDLPKDTKVEDYAIWQWSWNGLDLTAKFDPKSKKVIQLSCIARMDDKSDGLVCLTVGGVGLGRDKSTSGYAFYRRTEDHIVGVLGKPDSEEFSTVGETHRKIINYNELGLQFVLIGREAVNIYKYESNPSFFWWLQHGPDF